MAATSAADGSAVFTAVFTGICPRETRSAPLSGQPTAPRSWRPRQRRRLLDDLVNRVFDGSAKAVLLEVLQTSDVGPEELAEIRRLVDRKAKEHKK